MLVWGLIAVTLVARDGFEILMMMMIMMVRGNAAVAVPEVGRWAFLEILLQMPNPGVNRSMMVASTRQTTSLISLWSISTSRRAGLGGGSTLLMSA